ncbi:MAG: CheR family methyltransferase [Pseudomonadota bacterium]
MDYRPGRMNPPADNDFAPEDYRAFRVFLRDACGIVLGDNKQYLVANRLRRILEEQRAATLSALVQQIRQGTTRGLRERVIDAMTTNETFWFRDSFPFDTLREELLPRLLLEEKRNDLRIWSAACSFGQEPYSISMIVDEFRQRRGFFGMREPSIVATDISSAALESARGGCYDRLSVSRGLSEARRRQYFRETADGQYQLAPAVRSRVSFRQLNLLQSYAGLGQFDIIFCRNVLIYFAAESKVDILRRMHAALRPGSYLMLGASESMPAELASLYRMERANNTTFYRRQ